VETENFHHAFLHRFYLIAPALNFYRYPLLDVEHHVTQMYPATIKVTWSEKQGADADLEIQAANEQEFKDGLKQVFAKEETKKVIGALLAQSTENP